MNQRIDRDDNDYSPQDMINLFTDVPMAVNEDEDLEVEEDVPTLYYMLKDILY